MKKENKQYLKETLIIIILGILINAACFFLGSFSSKAATLPSGSLPYNVANYKELNPILTDNVINALYSDTDFQSYISSLDNYIIYVDDVTNQSGRANISIRIIGNPYTTNIYDSNFDYLNNRVYFYGTSWGLINIHLSSDGSIYRVQWRGTNQNLTSFELLGVPVPTINSNVNLEYTARYPFAIKSTIFDSTGNNYVFINAVQITIGEFTDLPDLDELLNNISNSFTPHSNNTPPTYDSNLSDGENISNAINGHSNNMNNAINNLGNNIKNWFDNLQDKLTQGFNSVSQNIWNGFKTLMANIKDFFGEKLDYIIEKLDYITEPLSLEELTTNLNNGSFSSDLLGVIVSVESFESSFTDGSEPNSCTFTLDFSNAFYNFGVCSFSLDWLLPIRPIIRLFLGGLCVYSLIVSIFTSLNTYIGGTSSINDDI